MLPKTSWTCFDTYSTESKSGVAPGSRRCLSRARHSSSLRSRTKPTDPSSRPLPSSRCRWLPSGTPSWASVSRWPASVLSPAAFASTTTSLPRFRASMRASSYQVKTCAKPSVVVVTWVLADGALLRSETMLQIMPVRSTPLTPQRGSRPLLCKGGADHRMVLAGQQPYSSAPPVSGCLHRLAP